MPTRKGIGKALTGVIAAIVVLGVLVGLGLTLSPSNSSANKSSSSTHLQSSTTNVVTSRSTSTCGLTPYDYVLNDTRYISNSTILWSAGNWVSYYKLYPGHGLYIGYSSNSSISLTGSFEATAPIYMSVMTADQLNNYSATSGVWESGLSTSSSMDVTLAPGTYFVVFHNPNTGLTNMTISQDIIAHYPGC